MTYTLAEFCRDAHDGLVTDHGPAGRETVRRGLERLLANPDFVAQHLDSSMAAGKRLLHRDPQTGILVLAHGTDAGGRIGKPHDHGASWAVYGQASGVTEMTVWRRRDDGRRDGHAEIEVARRFRLDPGVVALFDPGVIHSTAHPVPARWVRVTGTDLDRISRARYDPERQTVEEMNPGA